MVMAVVQQVNVASADAAASTIAATITASNPANLLVAVLITGGQSQTGVTDNGSSGGNAYTQEFLKSIDAAHCHAGVYMTTAATTKAATVITGTAAAGDIRAMTVYEISVANNASPFDSANGAAATGAPPTTGLTGTPSTATGLVIGVCAGLVAAGNDFSSPAFTSGAGTFTHTSHSDGGSTMTVWAGYLQLASATAQEFTITTSGSTQGVAASVVALIKPAGATPAPTVTGVSPASGAVAGGTPVTITGTSLTGASAVAFGASAATSVVVVNSTTITCVAPAHSAATVDVTVTTSGGTSATSSADHFTYSAAAPVVSGISPAFGTLAGGTSVTISGSGFTGASAVTFGGIAAGGFSVTNDSTIVATSPAGALGGVDVRVTTGAGTSAANSSDVFTYTQPPGTAVLSPGIDRIPYLPKRGGDLVVEANAPEEQVRFWVAGDRFPRIVIDIPNHAILSGDGTAAPLPLSAGGGTGTIAQTTQAGTSYTFALVDVGTVTRFTAAGAVTATIPPNSSVAYPVGAILTAYAAGAAGVTVAAGAGVTIRNNSSAMTQFEEASFRQDAIDSWVRVG